MKRTKIKIAFIALAIALVSSVAAFFANNFTPARASGTVTVSGTNVFTASGEANVVVHKEDRLEGDDKDKFYTMFAFGGADDKISYRRNLAYSWYEEAAAEPKADAAKPVHGLFNMEIGFRNTDFKKFIITFESQQYAKTEAGKTLNYIIFFPDGVDGVKVLVTDDKEDENASVTLDRKRINIEFVEGDNKDGEYAVRVSNGGNPSLDGVFKNVGGSYAKYSSSSSTPVYPLIFNAETEEGSQKTAQMVMYSLNKQEFAVSSANAKEGTDYYTGGYVTDNQPPVLCLNGNISHIDVGGTVKFDYQVIDVLRSSPSSTLYYYPLTCKDKIAETPVDFNDHKEEKDAIFKEVKTDTLLDSDAKYYKPAASECGRLNNEDDFEVDMAVKVYAKLVDTSSSSGETSRVFLDWYLKDGNKVEINGYDFIAVGKDKRGVTYNYDDNGKWLDGANGVIARYQEKVTKAAANLSAGSSSYFYLPSAEELFVDNATSYADMKISIYYRTNEESQNSSLAANNLSINVSKPGSYRFTLYASDVSGNEMYYMDDGEMVEFKTSDIWGMYDDDKKHDFLPWFEFSVDYKGVQFKEKPEKQSTAFVGKSYTSAAFEINGIANSYTAKYRLFLFDRAKYYEDTKITFTYEKFIEKMDELFVGDDTRKYFKEIKEVQESDEDYDKFKDYGWSSSSTNFTPQDGNAFYYMLAELTDTEYNTDPVTCSLAVVASVEAKALKGDSEWVKNNLASVILLSVAGASLIAIVLLLVIKPKSREDIDVQFEREKDKKKKSK